MALVEKLKSFEVFAGFSDRELAALASIALEQAVPQGGVILREGDSSNEIFFVVDGEVEFFVADAGGAGRHKMGSVGRGEMFGEMAWLDGAERSATVVAATDCALLCVQKQALAALPDGVDLDRHLTREIAKTITSRYRRDNANVVAYYEREREARDRQHEFGQFFVYVLVCFAIGLMVNHLLSTQLSGVDVHEDVFTWSYLLILLVPSVILVIARRMPLVRVGVTTSGWRKSLLEGVLASLGLCVLFAALVVVVRATGVLELHPPNFSILKKPEYVLHSYGQEFLARGLLQGSLQRFFDDGRGIVAVLMSSALFALLHIHFGFTAVALTFVSSVPLGLLYLRHENLLGVTLVHWAMGVLAFLSGLL